MSFAPDIDTTQCNCATCTAYRREQELRDIQARVDGYDERRDGAPPVSATYCGCAECKARKAGLSEYRLGDRPTPELAHDQILALIYSALQSCHDVAILPGPRGEISIRYKLDTDQNCFTTIKLETST